jgi:hypothetical protein
MRNGPAVVLVVLALAGGGCAAPVGDFGRPRANVLNDNLFPLAGDTLAWARGEPVSGAPFTDDERKLRDLAYAILMPPDDRQTWERQLAEWRRTRILSEERTQPNFADYSDVLLRTSYRSSTARYARLIEDIRADISRPGPFFAVAARVSEMDEARSKAINNMFHIAPVEREGASARIIENEMVIDMVLRRFGERCAGYQLALDRLVLATPAPAAVEAERTLSLFIKRLAEYRVPVACAALVIAAPPPPPPGVVVSK